MIFKLEMSHLYDSVGNLYELGSHNPDGFGVSLNQTCIEVNQSLVDTDLESIMSSLTGEPRSDKQR